MSYKQWTLLLLLVGGMYFFGGLDLQRAEDSAEMADVGWSSRLPLLIPTDNEAHTRTWYGLILMVAGGIYFYSASRKKKAPAK